jgi:hypothetical protein
MRNLDLYIVYRIIKILSTPWTEQPAFKLGIIDSKGRQLKKTYQLSTSAELDAYTILDRFVFNLKRLIELVPGGKSQIGSYVAALALLREGMETDELFAMQMMNEEDGGIVPANNIGSGAIDITPHWDPEKKKKSKKRFLNGDQNQSTNSSRA